jgi:hypothetical protein
MSIEQEITDLTAENTSLEAKLLHGRVVLQALQRALSTDFLDTLKLVIEEGYLSELIQRLGYSQELKDKAAELTTVATAPASVETEVVAASVAQ